MATSSSGEESDSADESEPSDPDYWSYLTCSLTYYFLQRLAVKKSMLLRQIRKMCIMMCL